MKALRISYRVRGIMVIITKAMFELFGWEWCLYYKHSPTNALFEAFV